MNIIFNQQLAKDLQEKYLVLELDTVMQPGMTEPIVLHAVIEMDNLQEMATFSFFKEMHAEMISNYKSGDWERTIDFASMLLGHWNKEIDEFYNLVIDFCQESAKVNKSWDGIRHTVPKE